MFQFIRIFLSTLVLFLSLHGITYEKTTCLVHVYTYEMNGIFHSYGESHLHASTLWWNMHVHLHLSIYIHIPNMVPHVGNHVVILSVVIYMYPTTFIQNNQQGHVTN
jgi:hypothetical protein